MTGPLADRVRRAWVATCGIAEAAFSFPPAPVAVAPTSALCPAGWAGLILIENQILATAPTPRDAEVVAEALEASDLTPEAILGALPIATVLGPAWLSYRSAALPATDPVETVAPDDPALADLLASVDGADTRESGLAAITSPAWVVRQEGTIIAAAGYRHWPDQIAHLSVLTTPKTRNRGLARRTAAAATNDAIKNDLLPQWRARPTASRKVANHLACQELGWQLSLKLKP